MEARGGVCTTVSNFPSFDASLARHFSLSLVDSVKYEDLELTIDKRRVFESLASLQRINYYALCKV